MKLSGKATHSILYAVPMVSVSLLLAPIYILQGIYAKHYGLALTTIAGVMLFARLFDAITDPVIGYLSDKSRINSGTRKPTIIIGAIVLVGSGYCLYSPPDDVSVLYFTVWFMVFYLGFTLFQIPHLAWGGEIFHGTHEKTYAYTMRTIAGYTGVALFYSIALLPIWETSEITPKTLKFSAVVSGLLMLPLLYFCVQRVPDGSCYVEQSSVVDKSDKPSKTSLVQFLNTLKQVIHNKPLLLFFAAFLFAGTALGMWLGLSFIFIDVYLEMGALFAEITLTALVVSIPGALVWLKITKYLDKKSAWLFAMLLAIGAFTYTGFLGPENVSYWSLLSLSIAISLCLICIEALAPSMLSDIVDYTTWKFRAYRGSTYFALYLFTYKAAFAVGGAMGLAIAGWYGFDPSASSETETAIKGLKLAMSWIPVLLVVVSMIFIALSPITVRRHRIVRRRLDAIEARLKRDNSKICTSHKGAKKTLTLLTSN